MIAGAVQRYLQAEGMSPVRIATLGDYQPGAGPVWAVYDEAGGDVSRLDRSEEWYSARLQIRARDDDMLRAVSAVRRAFTAMQAARGQTIEWTDPITGTVWRYHLQRIRPISRPTWFPTPEGGETATTNLDLRVREV